MPEMQRSATRVSAELLLRWMGRAFVLGLFVGTGAGIAALLG